ncbi:MAG: hypothetical protein WBA93_19360 [Microcoleaceae cyanobacterium]
MTETRHTQYDELLGWINIPNISIPNMYSEGIYFQTNSQSLRNKQDFNIKVPAERLRIICSRDLFSVG